jgi:REP element-mobilizing transposase RayT
MPIAAHRPGHHALRKGRVSLPGHTYLITIVCEHRTPRFSDSRCADATVGILHEGRIWRGAEALSWVLMPDHLHMLLSLGPSEPLPRLLNRIKSVTAQAANRGIGRDGRLWMRGYHDRALRVEEHLPAVARYILDNPVRAGIVATIDAYPYWHCAWELPALDR